MAKGIFRGIARVVSKDYVSSLIDSHGKTISRWKGLSIGNFAEGLASSSIKGRHVYGYVDHAGKMAIPARFESADDFSDGLAVVGVSGMFGYIDHSGKLIIPARFARAEAFVDGHALVIEEGPCRYTGYGPCAGFNPVVLPALTTAAPPVPGIAIQHCRYSMIEATGRVLFGGYNDAKHASEGLVPVGDGKRWGYVDYSGRPRIPMRFDNAEPFSEGLAQVRFHGKVGFVDKNGTVVIAPQFDSAEDFSEGVAVVTVARKSWFIDAKGKRIMPDVFDAASSFVMGLAHVRVGTDYYSSRWSYIEKSGKRYSLIPISPTGDVLSRLSECRVRTKPLARRTRSRAYAGAV